MIFVKESINSQNIVNEMYFGETDKIKELQKLISEIRKDYITDNWKKAKNNYKYATDERFSQIGKKIASIFGFTCVAFYITNSTEINAFTYPVVGCIDIKPETAIVKSSNGYKMSNKSKYSIIISVTSAAWLNPEISDREIMASILHEIGHSFIAVNEDSCAMVKAARIASIINLIISVVVAIITRNPSSLRIAPLNSLRLLAAEAINDKLSSDHLITKFGSIADAYVKSIMNMAGNVIEFLMRATGINTIIQFLSVPSNYIGKFLAKVTQTKNSAITHGRAQEYLADSFATIYGYGPEITTFLHKACYSSTKMDEIIKAIPIIGKLEAMATYPNWVLAETFCTHPSLAARANNVTKELKDELKKSNLPPELKKQLEANIKDMEEFRKEIIDKSKIANNDPVAYKKAWLAVIMSQEDSKEKVSEYEKSYVDMSTRDEYYQQLAQEQAQVSFFEQIEFI